MMRLPEWRKFEFKREKFIELMLYFSKRGIDEGLVIGSTKLNKLLFFSDFQAYAELGEPITGARYQKLKLGPAARAMFPVRKELVEERREARFQDRDPEDMNDVLEPLREPNMSLFTDEELRIADAVFEELRPLNAKDTSDMSHLRSAGWKVMDMFEDIPYESVFVSTERPPDEAVELGKKLMQHYGRA